MRFAPSPTSEHGSLPQQKISMEGNLPYMNRRDEDLSRRFALRCSEARAAVRKHMLERGLLEENGWTICEFTRESDGKTELVMRPIHRKLNPPSEFECACIIDTRKLDASSECRD